MLIYDTKPLKQYKKCVGLLPGPIIYVRDIEYNKVDFEAKRIINLREKSIIERTIFCYSWTEWKDVKGEIIGTRKHKTFSLSGEY